MLGATDSFLSRSSRINSQLMFFAEKYHRIFLDCILQLICRRGLVSQLTLILTRVEWSYLA